MTNTVTRTYVELEISEAAYNEIAEKLRKADYGHVFIKNRQHELINMYGIALVKEED